MTKNSDNQLTNKLTKTIFFIIFIMIIIFGYSFFFYSSEEGLKSVYRASYDWKIDFLATLSGLYIISIGVYLFINKKIKFVSFFVLVLIGASQSMMHIAKWIVRINFVA